MNGKRIGAALIAILIVAGCGGESDPVRPDPPLVLNDTPANTVARFMAAYEQERIAEYDDLFTTDFVWTFSTSMDPTLASLYPSGWTADDESISARNLFQGYARFPGEYQPPASSIDLNLTPATPQPYSGEGLDPTTHYSLLSVVDASVVIPPPPGTQGESTTYLIDNNVHRLFLVRGDVASLDAGQQADSSRWYIYRWDDETTGPVVLRATSTETATLGRLKAMYR